MTVCDLTHAYHETSGGIRTYIDAKRRFILDRTDHEHVLIVPGLSDAVRREGRATTVVIGSPTIPGAAPYRFFANPRRVLDALDQTAPDVVELGTFYMLTEWIPALRYRRHHPRSILAAQVHTDFASSYVGAYSRPIVGERVGGWFEGAASRYTTAILRRADLRLAPSPFQATRVAALEIGDVHVITLGVDTDVFAPEQADPEVRRELGVPEDAVFVAYAGRLDSEKRTATMARAAEIANRRRPTCLVLAGEGGNRPELVAAQAAGAPLRVLPYLDDRADLARFLASADVYLTAGPCETFGLSVVEAQACGLPVVGVQAGALVERVTPEVGFLGPVDDAETMAENLLRAADHRDAMGAAARAHVAAQFSWEASFETLFALYDEARRPALQAA